MVANVYKNKRETIMLYSIPASDYLTGKKRNLLSDLQDYYSGDDDVTIYVLSVEGSALGMFYASHGTPFGELSVGDNEVIEHTQTRAKKLVTVDNIVHLQFGKIVTSSNIIGISETDRKRPLWVAK